MIAQQDLEPGGRIGHLAGVAPEAFEERLEGLHLDQEQQFVLRADVVIEAGDADLGLLGDLADRGAVEAVDGEDVGGRGEDAGQFAVVAGNRVSNSPGAGSGCRRGRRSRGRHGGTRRIVPDAAIRPNARSNVLTQSIHSVN